MAVSHVSVFRFRLLSFVKSDEVGYFAVLCTAVVVARVSHASRLVFMTQSAAHA